jgi:hypothetical protein
MPVRRVRRRTVLSDLEAVRGVIAAGVHKLPTRAQQLEATRFLTDTQKSLLAHLCPTYKSVMKFLDHAQPSAELIEAAKVEMKGDIERAERRSAVGVVPGLGILPLKY